MSRIELQIINKTARIAPGKKKLNFLLEYTQKENLLSIFLPNIVFFLQNRFRCNFLIKQ